MNRFCLLLLLSLISVSREVLSNENQNFYQENTKYLKAIEQKKLIPRNKLFGIYEHYIANEIDSLYFYSKNIVEIGIAKEDQFYINYGKAFLISFFNTKQKIDIALKIGHQALSYFVNTKDYELISFVQNQIGISYIQDDNYVEAKKWLERSIQSGKSTGNFAENCVGLKNLAELHYRKGRLNEALVYIDHYIEVLKKLKRSNVLGKAYITKGNILRDSDRMEEAEKFYQYAYEIAEKSNSNVYIGNALTNMGIAKFTEQPEQAKELFYRALKVRLKTKNPIQISEGYLNIGHWYLEMSKIDSALYYYNKTLEYSTQMNYFPGQLDAYDALSELFEMRGDYKKAYEYATLNKELILKSNKVKQKALEEDIQTTYQLFNSEDRMIQSTNLLVTNNRLNQEFKKTNLILIIFLMLAITIIVFFLVYVKNNFSKIKENFKSQTNNQESTSKNIENLLDNFPVEIPNKLSSFHGINCNSILLLSDANVVWYGDWSKTERAAISYYLIKNTANLSLLEFKNLLEKNAYLKKLNINYFAIDSKNEVIDLKGSKLLVYATDLNNAESIKVGMKLEKGACVVQDVLFNKMKQMNLFDQFEKQLKMKDEYSLDFYVKSLETSWKSIFISKNQWMLVKVD